MTTILTERSLNIHVDLNSQSLIQDVGATISTQLSPGEVPIRFAVTGSERDLWFCDLGVAQNEGRLPGSIFQFHDNHPPRSDDFNVLMLVPTGIGAAVGGHAGDASPAATLLSGVCNSLITHPNVLNASDIIQIPPNGLYVEGSLISQLIMGNIGLRRVRNNKVLVLAQDHEDEIFTSAAINSVNAARATYGLDAQVILLDPRFRMFSEYTSQGVAVGKVEGIEYVYSALDTHVGEFDAIAITSVIQLPPGLHQSYYKLGGDVVNPWGGVEAMLTHAVSMRYGVPSAHAPMLESREASEFNFGIVDPRMAAEIISLAFLQCVLRGLQRSPAVVPLDQHIGSNIGTIGAGDISCLVIPDGCIGLPTLAALARGMPVIAVRGNTNLMNNDLSLLPWKRGQFLLAENYLEAAGIVAALRVGVDPMSVTRPLQGVNAQQGNGNVSVETGVTQKV